MALLIGPVSGENLQDQLSSYKAIVKTIYYDQLKNNKNAEMLYGLMSVNAVKKCIEYKNKVKQISCKNLINSEAKCREVFEILLGRLSDVYSFKMFILDSMRGPVTEYEFVCYEGIEKVKSILEIPPEVLTAMNNHIEEKFGPQGTEMWNKYVKKENELLETLKAGNLVQARTLISNAGGKDSEMLFGFAIGALMSLNYSPEEVKKFTGPFKNPNREMMNSTFAMF